MKRIVCMIMVVGMCVGCAQQVAQARGTTAASPDRAGVWTDAQCMDLMDRRDRVLLASKILVGVSGASAIVTPLPAWEDRPEVRWGFGAGTAALALTGGVLVWYGERKSTEFERYCEVVAPAVDVAFVDPAGEIVVP